MTRRSTATTIALGAFGLLLAGCVLPADDGDPYAEPTTVEVSVSPGPSRTSLEDTFTREEMDDYLVAVVPMVKEWVHTTWPRMSMPDVVYVANGVSGREGCLDIDGRPATYDSNSYEYCPPDLTIYVGQNTLWEFYSETGDAGPAMGLAHEFGHHIQSELGAPSPKTAEQSIGYENQADCLAGAWAKYTDEAGILETEDDLQDIEALFPIIGSAEGPDRDHGTASERENAFMAGFQRGVTACGFRAG